MMLAKNIGDLTNFMMAYSAFKNTRDKERKVSIGLELSILWERLPAEVQQALEKIGKEVYLKPKTS
jgi:hypothetical protein